MQVTKTLTPTQGFWFLFFFFFLHMTRSQEVDKFIEAWAEHSLSPCLQYDPCTTAILNISAVFKARSKNGEEAMKQNSI